MEKVIMQIRENISAICLPIENLKTAVSLKDEIIAELDKFCINSGEMLFQTILVNDILKPLYRKDKEIELLIIGNSRSKLHEKAKYLQIKVLLEFIYNHYKAYLKNEIEFIEYLNIISTVENKATKALLNNLDYYIEYTDIEILKESERKIINHLNNISKESTYYDLHYTVSQVFSRIKTVEKALKEKIEKISNIIDDKEVKIKNGNDYQTNYNGRMYKEILNENLIDDNEELSAYKNHFLLLSTLKDKIKRKFKFIALENVMNELGQYISHEKINDLIRMENLLLENCYLKKDEFGLTWIKKKYELVSFCRFLELNNFKKKYKTLSKFIVFMEFRYNINVGDQRKESKYKLIEEDEVKNAFEYLV